MLLADVVRRPLALAAGCALVALAVGLVGRWGVVLQVGIAFGVVTYAGALLERDEFDAAAPLVAAGFLAAAELAYTSIEPPARRVALHSAVLVVGAAAVALLLLAVAGVGGGRVRDLVLGVLAAAAALAVVARLAATATR